MARHACALSIALFARASLKPVAGTQPVLFGVDQKGAMVLDAEEQARVAFEGMTAGERRAFCYAQLAIGKRWCTC